MNGCREGGEQRSVGRIANREPRAFEGGHGRPRSALAGLGKKPFTQTGVKSDASSGAPVDAAVPGRVLQERPDLGSVGVHDEDVGLPALPAHAEDDLLAVRREAGGEEDGSVRKRRQLLQVAPVGTDRAEL